MLSLRHSAPVLVAVSPQKANCFHGVAGAAGELGHITADFEQPISCTCGKKGRLETVVASATGIVNSDSRRYADEQSKAMQP